MCRGYPVAPPHHREVLLVAAPETRRLRVLLFPAAATHHGWGGHVQSGCCRGWCCELSLEPGSCLHPFPWAQGLQQQHLEETTAVSAPRHPPPQTLPLGYPFTLRSGWSCCLVSAVVVRLQRWQLLLAVTAASPGSMETGTGRAQPWAKHMALVPAHPMQGVTVPAAPTPDPTILTTMSSGGSGKKWDPEPVLRLPPPLLIMAGAGRSGMGTAGTPTCQAGRAGAGAMCSVQDLGPASLQGAVASGIWKEPPPRAARK